MMQIARVATRPSVLLYTHMDAPPCLILRGDNTRQLGNFPSLHSTFFFFSTFCSPLQGWCPLRFFTFKKLREPSTVAKELIETRLSTGFRWKIVYLKWRFLSFHISAEFILSSGDSYQYTPASCGSPSATPGIPFPGGPLYSCLLHSAPHGSNVTRIVRAHLVW